jgi:hypothetical protein
VHRARLIESGVRRLASLHLWRAWRQWRSFAHQATASAAYEAARKRMAEDLAGEQSRFAGELGALHTALLQQKRKRADLLIGTWRGASQTAVFRAWRSLVAGKAERRERLLERCLRRLQHGGLWRAWRQLTTHAHIQRAGAGHEGKRQALLGQLTAVHANVARLRAKQIESVLHRWRVFTLARPFAKWRGLVLHKRAVVERALARLVRGRMWLAWREWRHQAHTESRRNDVLVLKQAFDENMRDARADAERLRAQARQQLADARRAQLAAVLGRWRQRIQAPAFAGWRQQVRESARRRQLVDRALRRMQHGAKWRLFALWRARSGQTGARRQKQVAALDRLTRRQERGELARMWRRWRRFAVVEAETQHHMHLALTFEVRFVRRCVACATVLDCASPANTSSCS